MCVHACVCVCAHAHALTLVQEVDRVCAHPSLFYFSVCVCCVAGRQGPFVIWEAGSGLILVDEELAALNWGRPEVAWTIDQLSARMAQHTAFTLTQVGCIPPHRVTLVQLGSQSHPPE